MKFSSIKEYFYKLQSRCYALLMLPLALIIAFYVISRSKDNLFQFDEPFKVLLRILFPSIAFIELTTVHLVLKEKLKQIRKIPGLGDKLDKYVSITSMATAASISASLLMLTGLFLTGDELFTVLFFVCVGLVYLQRPTPLYFSKQLQLKGDERELILKGKLGGM
jgi:hypothetical protein